MKITPNRNLLLLCCALAAIPAAPGQSPATAPAPKLLAEPLATDVPDNTRYLNRPNDTRQVEEQVAAIQGQPCDMIFIGDSITAAWITRGRQVWDKYYGRRHPLDFGVSGDTTQNVLWRLDHMAVKDLRPKVAVILIGTNNVLNTPEEIARGVNAVVARTQTMYPGVKVILVSIMPNHRTNRPADDATRINRSMMAADAIIRNTADDRAVFYLDLVPLMTPVGDNWKGLRPDHLHPDASGYELWASAMEPLVSRLLPNP